MEKQTFYLQKIEFFSYLHELGLNEIFIQTFIILIIVLVQVDLCRVSAPNGSKVGIIIIVVRHYLVTDDARSHCTKGATIDG